MPEVVGAGLFLLHGSSCRCHRDWILVRVGHGSWRRLQGQRGRSCGLCCGRACGRSCGVSPLNPAQQHSSHDSTFISNTKSHNACIHLDEKLNKSNPTNDASTMVRNYILSTCTPTYMYMHLLSFDRNMRIYTFNLAFVEILNATQQDIQVQHTFRQLSRFLYQMTSLSPTVSPPAATSGRFDADRP